MSTLNEPWLESYAESIVCVVPDSGERYLSTELFDGLQGQEMAS
jgi:hypothetical protein